LATVPVTSAAVSGQVQGQVLQVTLNRPEKRNALSRQMIDDLCRLIRWAGHETDVRSVLLRGNGKAFCAGDDLDGLGPVEGVGPSDSTELDAYQPVVMALLRLRKPSVACVHGAAYGAGMDLALACDLRVGGPATRYGPVTTKVGGSSFTTLLPLYVGIPKARRLLFFSDPIEAQEALALGLIDDLAPDEQVFGRAEAMALKLAEGPTRAYALIKQSLFLGMAPQVFSSLLFEDDFTRVSMDTRDAREGTLAGEEGRIPRFTGE
jgi:2-(1,2-epoxy-1,2-dihydrophenyl)acetyl-CoA isomerase